MKSGTLPTSDRQRADDVIAGSDRDPSRLTELDDADPDDVGEAQAVTADAS
jgi:hypothetical protein